MKSNNHNNHITLLSLTSADGGVTWLGLDYNGNAGTGGTGCPGPAGAANDANAAKTWLQTKYISQGLCCGLACSDVAATPATSLVGQRIGSSSTNVCTIVPGTSGSFCQSYVRYRFLHQRLLNIAVTYSDYHHNFLALMAD